MTARLLTWTGISPVNLIGQLEKDPVHNACIGCFSTSFTQIELMK